MGCLAVFLNFLLPGLGTLLFTTKRVQGFIQLVLTIINAILIFATLGLWALIGGFIHLGLLIWAIVATMTFMSEQAAKKAVREHMDNENK
jgi:predicted membrane protein